VKFKPVYDIVKIMKNLFQLCHITKYPKTYIFNSKIQIGNSLKKIQAGIYYQY